MALTINFHTKSGSGARDTDPVHEELLSELRKRNEFVVGYFEPPCPGFAVAGNRKSKRTLLELDHIRVTTIEDKRTTRVP
jgi:hypothetical protein